MKPHRHRTALLFLACAPCHTDDPGSIGPDLKGVFGRKSAALNDFRYSNPMKRFMNVSPAPAPRASPTEPGRLPSLM